MKREIKFRLWSNSLKIMFSPNSEIRHLWSIKEAPNGNIKVDDGDVLMQFTGMKDKNGVEIYEGDIVRIIEAQRNYVVKFHNGCFKLFHYNQRLNDNLWGTIERLFDLFWSVEIIGNIYEN